MQIKTTPQQALRRKYPEQVVLVTTRGRNGRANVMAVGWIACASMEPPMFVLGIDQDAFTYRLIRETKEFVVAFPNEKMGKETLYVGSHHGHNIDKFAITGLKTQSASLVQAPLLADATANFECKLKRVIQPGDCPLLIGEVVAAHQRKGGSSHRLYTVAPNHKLGGVRHQ